MEPPVSPVVHPPMILLALLLACPRPPQPEPEPPRIGVAGWDGEAAHPLIHALAQAGAVPVAQLEHTLTEDTHALVLPGGADLDPLLYGEARHERVTLVPRARQGRDLALATAALEGGVPVLGICLGAQELVVARGGSLVQHIPAEVPDPEDHLAPHPVRLLKTSRLARAHGALELEVSSRHHQSPDPDDLGHGVSMAAYAPDHVVEAVELDHHPFAVGVQWHPEDDPDHAPVLDALVQAAVRHREEPAPGVAPVTLPHLEPVPPCGVVHSPVPDPDRRSLAALEARVTSHYGDARASFVAGHKHAGVDIAMDHGQPVHALCPGRVVDLHLGFPHRTVVVEHTLPDGRVLYSSYKHVEGVAVGLGDPVDEATAIARMFTEAEAAEAPWGGAHLHLELRHSISDGGVASWTSMSMDELNAWALDPLAFLRAHLE